MLVWQYMADNYSVTVEETYDRYTPTCFFPDIDECEERLNNCDSYADCHNTEGSYTCQCHEGSVGDGHQCRG